MKSVLPTLLVVLTFPAAVFAQSADGHEFYSYLGFTLENAKLGDIVKKLGDAKPIWSGTENNDEVRVCYVTDNAVISFGSIGDMGGASDRVGTGHNLEGFTVSQKNDTSAQGCQLLPRKYVEASKSLAGLSLGISRQEFAGLLGQVTWEEQSGSRHFLSQQKMNAKQLKIFNVPDGGQDYFDVSVTVEGKFTGGELFEFSVWKVSSY